MDKNQFHLLIQNFASLEKEEADQLIALQKNYPYSQVISNLAARAAQDFQLADKDHYLHISAIYSSDRAVLKSMLTTPKTSRVQPVIVSTTEEKLQPTKAIPSKVEPATLISTSVATIPSGNIYDQVMLDIDLMHESKKRFEEMVAKLENSTFKPLHENLKTVAISKKIESIEPEQTDEALIEEIKNSKRKIKPDGPKQKEQIEIIDQFIKAQPSIPKPKAIAAPSEDLAEKNDLYGANIVSETLVEILLKQGKKEKAIEMLKKLIWKFPQKKTYFAAQIEDLKK